MATLPPLLPLLLLLLLFLLAPPTSAWKKDEFRTCNQTPFCKRSRTRDPHSLPPLSASSLSISDGRLTALLLPSSNPLREVTEDANDTAPADPPPPLLLELSVYPGGVLRLKIDEDRSSDPPPKKRFEVPDVLLPGLDSRLLWLSRLNPDGSFYLADGFDAFLRPDPFEILVRRSGSGDPVLSLNSNGLFDFEHIPPSLLVCNGALACRLAFRFSLLPSACGGAQSHPIPEPRPSPTIVAPLQLPFQPIPTLTHQPPPPIFPSNPLLPSPPSNLLQLPL